MKNAFLIFVACLFATPTIAASTIDVSLNRDQAQLVLNLLDNAVKAGGIQAAKDLVPIADAIVAAGRAAQVKDSDALEKALKPDAK